MKTHKVGLTLQNTDISIHQTRISKFKHISINLTYIFSVQAVPYKIFYYDMERKIILTLLCQEVVTSCTVNTVPTKTYQTSYLCKVQNGSWLEIITKIWVTIYFWCMQGKPNLSTYTCQYTSTYSLYRFNYGQISEVMGNTNRFTSWSR